MRKKQAFLIVKTRFGAAICALGLTILSTAVPAEARRAYSSYGDIDEKTLENILNGKSPAKKAARPKPKRRKPVSSAASSSSSGDKAVNSSGSAATSAASSSSSNQSSSQSANPNAASFAALAPVPTLQKGSLKGLSKKLSALVEMSPPTSLDMDKEQALSVGSK